MMSQGDTEIVLLDDSPEVLRSTMADGSDGEFEASHVEITLPSSEDSDSDVDSGINKKCQRRAKRGRILPIDLSEDEADSTENIYSTQIKQLYMLKKARVELVDDKEEEDRCTAKSNVTRTIPSFCTKSSILDKLDEYDNTSDINIEEEEERRVENPVVDEVSLSPPPSPEVEALPSIQRSRETSKLLRGLERALNTANSIRSADQFEEEYLQGTPPSPACKDTANDRERTVRIRCRADIHRFTMKEADRFDAIMESLANKLDVVPKELLVLLYKDRKIAWQESPVSLQLHIADILDCIVMDGASSTIDDSLLNDCSQDPDAIQLKVQSVSGKRVTSEVISISKKEPLSILMQRYSEIVELPCNWLCFRFDGEVLHGKKSAEELDMENDDCIDVTLIESAR